MKNHRFLFRGACVVVCCFFMQYFYSCLAGDSLNVLQIYLPEEYGWSTLSITTPVTVGALLAVPGTLVFGSLIMRVGAKWVLVPTLLVMSVCQGLIAVTDNLWIYSVSMCMIRLLIQVVSLGLMTLVSGWFVSWRGRVLGIITIGSQFNTATSVALLTKGCDGIGFQKAYLLLAGAVALLAMVTAIAVHDSPAHYGLWPDGGAQASVTQENTGDSGASWPLRRIFSTWSTWVLILGMGFLTFVIKAIMPNFMPRMLAVGFSKNLTLTLLTVATLCGMPISYLFGWLNDRFGAPKACICLAGAYIMTVTAFIFASPGAEWILFFAVLGIGCITGGTASLYPALALHIYGQEQFTHVNRYVMTIQNFFVAFAVSFMSAVQTITGTLDLAFWILLGMSFAGFVLLLTIRNIPRAA